MSHVSFCVAFEAATCNVEALRSQLDNALQACGTPAKRKAFLVADIAHGVRACMPDARGYKVVPADKNGIVTIAYTDACTPSDHAALAQLFKALSQRVLRHAKSISTARGYAIEGQRAERSDKRDPVAQLLAMYEKLDGGAKRSFKARIA